MNPSRKKNSKGARVLGYPLGALTWRLGETSSHFYLLKAQKPISGFFNTPVRKCIDNRSIAFKLVARNIQGGYQ